MKEEKDFLEFLEKTNFQKRLKQLKKRFKNKRIVLYGTGKLFEVIKENYDLSCLNIIGVSDLKFKTDNEDFLGYKTIKFENIINYKPDVIIVSTLNYEPIINNFKNFYFVNLNIKIDSLYKKSFLQELAKYLPERHQTKIEKYKQEIEELRSIINNCIDIKNLPKATGNLRDNQLAMVKILDIVDNICKQNNLNYWLDSGTLLGAYRHKGFIPWDDDIDICMVRDDYNKILPILEKYFENSDYYIRQRALTFNDYQITIVNRSNSKVALDIFPVDKYFKSNLTEEEKCIADKSIIKARLKFEAKYREKYVALSKVPQAKKELIEIQTKIVMENKKPTKEEPALFFGIDFPFGVEKHLIFDYSMAFPLKTIEFESKEYCAPNNIEGYLENLYGEFMGFPSGVFYEEGCGLRYRVDSKKRIGKNS